MFTFLNHAAVAPLSTPAAQRLRQYANQAEAQGNAGAGWYEEIETVRHRAAQLIGAESNKEIAFIIIQRNRSTGCLQYWKN